MKYKLGLDMGATSIGWAVINTQTNDLIDVGVRIFDDGREDKTKKPLCVKRRMARGMRRLTDRCVMRLRGLLSVLQDQGLFPKERTEMEALKNQNPYQLRAEALDRDLKPYELGRILMQLAKRRGFYSNRKEDKKEGGKLKAGYEDLLVKMKQQNARTYGEFLYQREQAKKPIRLKNAFDENGAFVGQEPFPFRQVYMREFDMIRERQGKLMPAEVWEQVREKIFFQRPLKEVEEGNCPFEKGEKCLPKAHPLFQEFRIWQTLLNLKFQASDALEYRALTQSERERLLEMLWCPQQADKKGILSYAKIKKALGLDKKGVFNFEGKKGLHAGEEKGLLTNTTEYAMRSSEIVGPYWEKFSFEQKEELIQVLFRPNQYIDLTTDRTVEAQDKKIRAYLQEHFKMNVAAAEEVMDTLPLEEGVGALSAKAIQKLLPLMKEEVPYHKACEMLKYTQGECFQLDYLPYYGMILSTSCMGRKNNPQTDEERYGKINNATVHVALNQVRHLINELIDKYGKPYDIAIEYARELTASSKERNKIEAEMKENEKENQRIIDELKEKAKLKNPSKSDIQKYKIWENMAQNPVDRRCPYTGKQISVEALLNGNLFQIEHLIPFARSLDDSMANKVISWTGANRYKGNRTPYEAFGKSQDGYDWNQIQARAKKLSPAQQWRFEPKAMEKFNQEVGPMARALNDTRYMTRLLQAYLRPIVREDGRQTIQSVPGRLTALVRTAWDLNLYKDKNNPMAYREKHNHHAIDAYIVAAISRRQIEAASVDFQKTYDDFTDKMEDEKKQLSYFPLTDEEKEARKKKLKDIYREQQRAIVRAYFPFPKDWAKVMERVKQIVISHKPSLKNACQTNSTVGQLHEETAYGWVRWVDEDSLIGEFQKVAEKDENGNKIKKVERVAITTRVPMFRTSADKKAYYDAYREWFIWDGKARTMLVRCPEEKAEKQQVAQKEQEAIQALRAAAEKAFKWFIGGNNYCAEIYQVNPQNKIKGVPTTNQGMWESEIVSHYQATVRRTRGEEIAYWLYKYPNARRLMTLKRNDMVRATFTRAEAFGESFPKGIQEVVRSQFEQRPHLKKINILFRVKKISSDGRIALTPHDIAKEKGDTKSFLASASSLKKYRVRRVLVTYTGEVRDAGAYH